MKFTVNKPSVWFYKTENLTTEVSDELLFGTVLELLSENETTAYCRTDYGYCGYINRWDLCDCIVEDCGDKKKQFVYSSCDILQTPEYRLAPVMSLPKGARIEIAEQYNERFSACIVGNKKYYIANSTLCGNIIGTFRENLVAVARSYLGTPYRWGGKSNYGIDCSGLVFMSARLSGKNVFRDAVPDERYVDIIGKENVQKGDLVYFKGHVAIVEGGGRIIHSSARYGRVISQEFRDSGLCEKDIVCYASIK
ncbi:MAG: C40 family peptidase [Clostridia bacterium]|nr:C40 family peptidase [Clostridia bacterium]